MSEPAQRTRRAAADPAQPESVPSGTDRFAWRRALRGNPLWNNLYRGAVAVLGAAIIAVGIVLLPLPGPGWVIIFLGIGLWATEFAWAKRLLTFARRQVQAWTDWLGEQAWWVKALVSLGLLLIVLAALWLVFWLSGVPGFVPAGLRDWMNATLHLRR